MEDYNPLLNGSSKKFITIGEIMLRLTPPNYDKIRMATSFEASYGGSEANIALALANLGVDSTFFSVVPNNSLGKSAVRAADVLRGKGKVTYTPHADCGDNVIIINAGKAILTGKKGEQKFYRTHSGWVGGLKEVKYRTLMQSKQIGRASCRERV